MEQQIAGTRAIRKLLSADTAPPAKEVIDSGLVPVLVQLLQRHDSTALQFEAAWALTNVASTQFTAVVVEAGATPVLVQLMLSADPDVREQCCWCLGNITGDTPQFRDMVLAMPDAMTNVLRNIASPASVSLLRNATWTLSNFCRGKPAPPMEKLRPLVPALAALIRSSDMEVVADACWALSYLTDAEGDRVQAVIESGALPVLVQLLEHADAKFVTPALRTVGNVISGTDAQTQAALDAGALPRLLTLLNSSKRSIRKEACWTLSNVAAGTRAHISTLVSTVGAVRALSELSRAGSWEVQKEAVYAIANICTGGTAEHIHAAVGEGALAALASMLVVNDSKMILVALDALHCVFKVDDESEAELHYHELFDAEQGQEKLEALQDHANEAVYQRASALIETYFDTEDGEEEDEEAAENAPAASGRAPTAKMHPAAGATPFPQQMQPQQLLAQPAATPAGMFSFGVQGSAAPFSFGAPAGGFSFA